MTTKGMPPQSPDLNKLDLCFFYSLQHRTNRIKSGDMDVVTMIKAVKKAYREYKTDPLRRVHALLYVVYREILINLGDNQYDMPHTGIRKRQRNGDDVYDFTVSMDIVNAAKEWVRRNRDI